MADEEPKPTTRDTLRAVADRGPAQKRSHLGLNQLQWKHATWGAALALVVYLVVALKECT